MDKDVVEIDYETGVRACLDFDGTMAFKTIGGDRVVFDYYDTVFNRGKPYWNQRWHALRAYQDEQRKKGVPITFNGIDIITWYNRDYAWFDFVLGSGDRPYIITDGAKFTNFRWREGYPKGKIRMGPDKLEISNVTVINPIKPGWGQEIRDKSGIQLKLVDGEWINVYGQE